MASTFANDTALTDLVNNISLADYGKTLNDNVYNSRVLLKMLNERKKIIDGGVVINRPLIKEKQNNGGFFRGAEQLNTTQDNTLTQVEFKWQNAYEPINITRDELRANRGSEHKLIDLMSTKMKLSEEGLADRMEEAFSVSVAGSQDLISLADLVGTGVLGSIDGASSTFWQSTLTTSGNFALQGLSDMTTAYYAVSGGATADNPTHFITTAAIFQKYEQTRLPLERISNSTMANAGFESLTFKGKPLVYGNYIGSGILYGLNMNHIELIVDKETDMVTTEMLKPINQQVMVAYILWSGNLTTTNRRRHFKLSSIS